MTAEEKIRDERSNELLAYDSALCEPMTLQQMTQYNAELVGSLTWTMSATPELADEMRAAMKRVAEGVLRR
jgi:hypothetical protein